MANRAVEYLTEAWDSLKNAKSNKTQKAAVSEEIDDFIDSYANGNLPDKPTLPDVPEYERIKYNAPDDAEIESTARSELAEYKHSGEKGIEREIAALEKQYAQSSESAKEAYDKAAESAEENYAAAKKNTDSDMLKRGLARSSIAANSKAELEKAEARAKSDISAEYTRKINEINENINALAAKREEALNDFNIAYAARLTERISELKTEREKKMTEAVKYNNTLTEKEHNAAVDKRMKESDLYSEALSQHEKEQQSNGITERDYANIYTEIANKLRTLNRNDARDIVLNDPKVRGSLSNIFYYKLYDEFCR